MKFRRVNKPKPVAWFTDFHKPADFEASDCLWCEPMLAQEISEQEQERQFKSDAVYVEEKFDGTRAILQFFDNSKVGLDCVPQRGYTRCFSRRVSKKTKWFCENTDSLPHLRDINIPELAGTVIDGEMFIDGRPFKDVSATLNCLWDEAVKRQTELGNITFHAFDIIRYKNINCEKMPLEKRKAFLQKVVDRVASPHLVMVPYYDTDEIEIHLKVRDYMLMEDHKEQYPELWKAVQKQMPITTHGNIRPPELNAWAKYIVSKKAYYEFIVLLGGEGVILKPKNGRYFHKRGKEYMKVKKFLTREVLITGFIPPTREYTGGYPKDRWLYWVDEDDVRVDTLFTANRSAKELKAEGFTPVTKFYYFDQIGTVEYGVIVTEEDKKTIKKLKELTVKKCNFFHGGEEHDVLVVGECSGITDEEREYMTAHQSELMGSVIEVKANELFKDTGKMRHPRFLRFRKDKNQEDCCWRNHIGVTDNESEGL
jgi:ATP-dependent DNA ligase